MNKIIKYFTLGLSSILIGCSQLNYVESRENYRIIKEIRTLEQAKEYCLKLEKKEDILNHGKRDHWSSFKKLDEQKSGDCEEGVIAIMTLLIDNKYDPKMLVMEKIDLKKFMRLGHCVFLYEKNGKYGSVGINKGDWKEAKYETIGDLVRAINKSLGKDFEVYYVADFSDFYDIIIHSDKDFTYLFEKKRNEAQRYNLDGTEYIYEADPGDENNAPDL